MSETMSDFKRLQPSIFAGIEGPIKAKPWTMVMENLLKATWNPKENRVEVLCVQVTDVART